MESVRYFNVSARESENIKVMNLDYLEDTRLFGFNLLNGEYHSTIGLFEGHSIKYRRGLGRLILQNSKVTLIQSHHEHRSWTLSNSSRDWEAVTFDRVDEAFLFGAPYDMDFRYILL